MGLYHPARSCEASKRIQISLTFWGATATLATPSGIGRDAQLWHTATAWADGTDGTMLAESLSLSNFSSLTAWLFFIVLLMASAAAVPLIAWFLRRRLPAPRRVSIPLEPVAFGSSPKSQRSPRHAVLQHRTLMTAAFIAVLALFLLPGIVAIRVLGVPGLQVAIALVLPTILVALHARQRNAAQ